MGIASRWFLRDPKQGKSEALKAVDINRPKTPFENACDLIAWFFLLLLVYLTVQNYRALPPRIPTHFDGRGQADGWGSRDTVWLLPATALFLFAMVSFAHRFPKFINYPVRITPENAQRQYDLVRTFLKALRAAMMIFFFALQWLTLATAMGKSTFFAEPWMMMGMSIALIFLPVLVYFYLAFRRR